MTHYSRSTVISLLIGAGVCCALTHAAPESVSVPRPGHDIIRADENWAPYRHVLEVEEGGVFDQSAAILVDAPAGKYGRTVVTPTGHLAFEDQPGRRARFWGVNLCFDSQFLEHEKADVIADRLARSGYNTVRFHHYDQLLVKNRGLDGSGNIDPEQLDRLEYLFAALKRRGIYVSIDLYSSRQFPASELPELGRPVKGEIKQLIPVSENAYQRWREFAQKLLTHRNPYSGLTWAEDPALLFVNLLNEESFFFGGIPKKKPDVLALYEKAYAAWRDHHPEPKPPALTASLYDPARPAISPDDVTPNHLLPSLLPSEAAVRDGSADAAFNRFLVELKITSDARMIAFLRDELGVRALLTGDNNVQTEAQVYTRRNYDVVDNHEYWNHPVRKGANTLVNPRSAIVADLWLPRELMPSRIFGKPYIVTEYNYCFPSPARSEGGVLMPAYSAFQDWDAVYLFDYAARSRDNAALFTPAVTYGPGYVFSAVTDPIGMLADRAAAFLFMHGDIRPAPEALAYLTTRESAFDGPKGAPPKMPYSFSWLGFQTRIGSLPADADAGDLADVADRFGIKAYVRRAKLPQDIEAGRPVYPLEPLNPDGSRMSRGLETTLVADGILPIRSTPELIRSGTGQMELSRAQGTARLLTDRAECFVTPPATRLEGQCVSVANGDTFATTWVLAVDKRPLKDSRRLLILHLTDSLNTGMRYTNTDRREVEDFGTLPHLVRRGATTITFSSLPGSSDAWTAWAVDAAGHRLRRVSLASAPDGGSFDLVADTVTAEGVTLAYELVRD